MKLIISLSFLLTFGSLKGQDVIDSVLYNHSISAPDNLNSDIEELSKYLSQIAKTDKQKIQVVSYWIANNIEYDLSGFFSNTYDDSSWANTLITKKAVCQGYSELFKEFCDLLNIECYLITGYAKGYGIEPGFSFQETNHAWNIVKVNGEFELFDLTWASGTMSYYDSLQFIKKLDRSYLFANPTEFVEKHLPRQARWQLLHYPITMESYQNKVNYEDMSDSTCMVYNFSDSIASYLELNLYDSKMKDFKDAYLVFPSELNLAQMNYYMAYLMTFGKYDEERYKQCIELFKTAKAIYQKPKYNDVSYAVSCQEYINFINK